MHSPNLETDANSPPDDNKLDSSAPIVDGPIASKHDFSPSGPTPITTGAVADAFPDVNRSTAGEAQPVVNAAPPKAEASRVFATSAEHCHSPASVPAPALGMPDKCGRALQSIGASSQRVEAKRARVVDGPSQATAVWHPQSRTSPISSRAPTLSLSSSSASLTPLIAPSASSSAFPCPSLSVAPYAPVITLAQGGGSLQIALCADGVWRPVPTSTQAVLLNAFLFPSPSQGASQAP